MAKTTATTGYKHALAALKALGYKVTDRETTPGAYKTWLRAPSTNVRAMRSLATQLGHHDGVLGRDHINFPWGEATNITPRDVVVVKYRRGTAGEEYRHGIDA
jgi:hypothetical protein